MAQSFLELSTQLNPRGTLVAKCNTYQIYRCLSSKQRNSFVHVLVSFRLRWFPGYYMDLTMLGNKQLPCS